MARTALIGSNGQLGTDIARLWLAGGKGELICLTHADLDVTDEVQVRSVLMGIEPDLVINTAAFHRVDDCESQMMEAFRVNVLGVKYLAEACRDLGSRLMHFSTDYVFSGQSKTPYQESEAPQPISAYGISKAGGEQVLRYTLPDDHILIRSSGLYGVAGASGKGGNFVEAMLRLAREGKPIKVVDDQRSSPSYTYDVALALFKVMAQDGRGTFHITSTGDCSWYEFAQEIFSQSGLKPELSPTTSKEFAAAAQRPAYSVLANLRLKELGIDQPRPWREALSHYLSAKGHRTRS